MRGAFKALVDRYARDGGSTVSKTVPAEISRGLLDRHGAAHPVIVQLPRERSADPNAPKRASHAAAPSGPAGASSGQGGDRAARLDRGTTDGEAGPASRSARLRVVRDDRADIDDPEFRESLIAAFAATDPEATAYLYRHFSSAVLRVALSILGDRQLAEDAVQQTFVKAWRAASRYDPSRAIQPWLYQIARRTAIDTLRSEERARRRSIAARDAEPHFVVDDFDRICTRDEMGAALDALSVRDRELLRMIYFEELSHAQVAKRLSIPLGTVKSRSHRALSRLAHIWGERSLAS